VSLNIFDADGAVVRQLLNAAFYTKGAHEVKWDGLTTTNWRMPGEPVPAGEYHWEAIWNPGIGLKFRGWADNGGRAPWDGSPPANWGGDHGVPSSVVAVGKQVLLGWTAAEAGKALLACDLNGNVRWHVTRGGIGGAERLAVEHGTVYAVNGKRGIYRVDLKTGDYTLWAGTDSTDLSFKGLLGDAKGDVGPPAGLAADSGKLFLAYPQFNQIAVLNSQTGKLIKALAVPSPGAMVPIADGQLLTISDGTSVVRIDVAKGTITPFIKSLNEARGLATDASGRVFVAVDDPDNQVIVYDVQGAEQSRIGKRGGRPLLGPWQTDGMRFVKSIAVDTQGKLWAMEADVSPKRVSVWDVKSGKFEKEFFGPTAYGALGGAINPRDPNLMVGSGCE
jgi:DNA-binding beta-propeller fold protein YncE